MYEWSEDNGWWFRWVGPCHGITCHQLSERYDEFDSVSAILVREGVSDLQVCVILLLMNYFKLWLIRSTEIYSTTNSQRRTRSHALVRWFTSIPHTGSSNHIRVMSVCFSQVRTFSKCVTHEYTHCLVVMEDCMHVHACSHI